MTADQSADDEDAFDYANARIAVAQDALRRAEEAFEAARAHVPGYALLESAERDFAMADAAYWHDGESTALLAPRLAARATVRAARRAYHGVRESLAEYQHMIRAEADLASAVQARDSAWPRFSRTAARRDRVVAATDAY